MPFCLSCTFQSSVPTFVILYTALPLSKEAVASPGAVIALSHPSLPLEKPPFFNIFSPAGVTGTSGAADASVFSRLILSIHIRCLSLICVPPTAPIEILRTDFKSVSFFIWNTISYVW